MYEYRGNMHMHTPYSDGEQSHSEIAADAIRAGLDFIIVTDHNIWLEGLEGYHETADGRVLVLIGEEVHNVRRIPQANHLLVYGADKELADFAADPQVLINEVNQNGGCCFLAHPFEKDVPIANEPNYGWHDWDVDGYHGLEIWNYMSSIKNELARGLGNILIPNYYYGMLRIALPIISNPDKYVAGPEPAVLHKWDQLLATGKRVAAVGNSDAHATVYSLGPIKRVVLPYYDCFTAVNTHILTTAEFNGNLEHDRKLILEALRLGRSWIGYERPGDTKGFRFSGQSINKGVMGDEVRLDAGATLQVKTPAKAHIKLIRHGETVAEVHNETNLTHIPVEPGAYRVECHREHLGQPRGWIFSNPIYLR